MDTNDAPRHPIGVAAERTGLTADVIRIWERRYEVVDPARNPAGQRVYSDADVERLRLLRRATEGGRTIGQVAPLDPEALAELVREDEAARRRAPRARGSEAEAPEAPSKAAVDAVVELALSLDGTALETALRHRLAERGFAGFVEGIAAPLLRRLGDAWHAGEATAAQEHLASVAVRRVVESVRTGAGRGPAVVVATLTGERHEAGALMAAAAADLAGWRVVYLGADLPAEAIADAVEGTDARAVCASTVYESEPGEVVERFRWLRLRLPDHVTVYAGGAGAAPLKEALERLGVRCPGGVAALQSALVEQAAGAGG